MMKKTFIIISACVLLCAGCEKNPSHDDSPAQVTPYYKLNKGDDAVDSHAGATDRSMLTFVGGSFVAPGSESLKLEMPVYPRFIKTNDGRYLMFYHNGTYNYDTGSVSWAGTYCCYAESADLKKWTYVKEVFPIQEKVNSVAYGDVFTRTYAGPHPVRLADGNILVVASYRNSGDFRHRVKDNGLAVKISRDEGRTWSMEQRINVGTNWEPRPIVLPSGRVIIYYTDSCPFIEKVWSQSIVSSGVSYIYSDDNGVTWKPDNPLDNHLWAFRQLRDEKNGVRCYTDQMPGVIKLNGSNRLVGCGESNMAKCSDSNTNYWISLAYSEEDGTWGDPDASGVMPRERCNALFKGAAPTIEQFTSGETVLTYNSSDGKSNVFRMHMGDHQARNWGDQMDVFFGSNNEKYGFWGSVLCDGHIMVAGVGGSGGGSQGKGYKMKIGHFYLNHDISASSHAVNVDGDNADWKDTDQALFVGSDSDLHATLRCSASGGRMCFLAEVDAEQATEADYIGVYLASASGHELAAGDIYLKISPKGESRFCTFKKGWFTEDLSVQTASKIGEDCYIAEFSLPLSVLPKGERVKVNFAVSDNKSSVQSLLPTLVTDTSKWLEIKL